MLVNGVETPFYSVTPEGEVFNSKGHLMTKFLTRDGYFRVKLSQGVKRGMYRVNRLVAENFIPNPNEFPIVNHLNNLRTDNRVENLEWCTNSINQLQRFKNMSGTRAKPVEMCELDGTPIRVFSTPLEAFQETGIQRQNIAKVARGERVSAGGFYWRYVEGSETIERLGE